MTAGRWIPATHWREGPQGRWIPATDTQVCQKKDESLPHIAGMTAEVSRPHLLQREFLLIGVMPDIVYRASILVSYRMDPRLKPRG